MTTAHTSSHAGVRIEPISVKGRYFLFAQEPPTVMILDAATVLVIRLAQAEPAPEDTVRVRFRGLMARRGTDTGTSDRLFDDAVASLRTAGLGRLVDRTAT
ncbi:hypothetical protein ACIO7M_12530 [Streptomyces toxytricini]|uniref:Uncharacterized protein n=1 Tax=Streptomyces toxytricini TaxID=67369 RepID=A0ABW8EFB0_STRT5